MTMTYTLKQLIVSAIASLVLLGSAHADDALKMQLSANKVTTASDGKVTYAPISTAPAGTVVQYKATYLNTIDRDIQDLAVVLPVPTNMTFTGEASPASAQGSIDGKNYADMPLMRKVDGKMVKIPYSEYRTLRWNIKLLPAKKTAAVMLNTTVNK